MAAKRVGAGNSSANGNEKRGPKTLAVDVGGSGIKAQLLDAAGAPIGERSRIETPKNATPRQVVAIIRKLAAPHGDVARVSVGFPGVVKEGVIRTAPNLGAGWKNFPLERELTRVLDRPVRIANDADVQGLGSIEGRGVEMLVTLGTGFGSVVFVNGHRIHLELGHHPFRKGKTYEDELGFKALEKNGEAQWNKRLDEAIVELRNAFVFDRLYIGGGNTKYIRGKLPNDVTVVENNRGLLGGIALWREKS